MNQTASLLQQSLKLLDLALENQSRLERAVADLAAKVDALAAAPAPPTYPPLSEQVCNLCGYVGPFLNHGLKRRFSVKCPRCRSLERHRFLWHLYQTHVFNDPTPKRVLHFAPERCFSVHFGQMPEVEWTPTDIDAKRYGKFKNFVPADITALPFEEGRFDAVLCNHVLEHIPDDRKAMAELYRVLKPDGLAIVTVPYAPGLPATYEDFSITDPKGRERAFGQHDHVRTYGNDVAERLASVGFAVETITSEEVFSVEEKRRYAISSVGQRYAFLCQKPAASPSDAVYTHKKGLVPIAELGGPANG